MADSSIFSQMSSDPPEPPADEEDSSSRLHGSGGSRGSIAALDVLAYAASGHTGGQHSLSNVNTSTHQQSDEEAPHRFSTGSHQQSEEGTPRHSSVGSRQHSEEGTVHHAQSSVLGRRTRECELEWSPRTKARLQEYTTDKCAEYGIAMDDRASLIEQSMVSQRRRNIIIGCRSDEATHSFQHINSSSQWPASSSKTSKRLSRTGYQLFLLLRSSKYVPFLLHKAICRTDLRRHQEHIYESLKLMLLDPNLTSYKVNFLNRSLVS